MHIATTLKCSMPAALLFFTTGCVHDVHYTSAKHHRYESATAFANNRITEDSWVDVGDEQSGSRARYTSSTLIARERYNRNILGTLHITPATDTDTDAEPIVLTIRRDNRSYMAETPVLTPVDIGKKKLVPHLTMGRHRDHDIMAGLNFRMSF